MSQHAINKRKWFGHPAVIGSLVIVLFIDLQTIASRPEGVSRIRDAILGIPSYDLLDAHGERVPGMAVRKGEKIEWLWPTEPELDSLMSDPDVKRLNVTVFHETLRREGLYHLTRRTHGFFVWQEPLSEEDQQAVLDAILVAVDRAPEYEQTLRFVPDLIRGGVKQRVVPMYGGYVRNGIASVLAISLALCCTIGRPWLWLYDLHRRRSRMGLCGACGYDLAGITVAVCPECGNPTGRDA